MMFFLIKTDTETLGGSMSEAKDNILAKKWVEEGMRCQLRDEGICEWMELLLQSRVSGRFL